MTQQLSNLRNFLQGVYENRIQADDDLVLLMIGDEGAGKSTAMLEMAALWHDITDRSKDPDDILERVVFGGREAYKDKLMDSDRGDIITVQDAPHVLFSKDAMVGEQKDIEKAMFDIRMENYLIVLGFQSWEVVPSDLRGRRAGAAIRVYRRDGERGYMDIFGRREIDEKFDDHDRHSWPDPSAQDRFPSLDGTDLWDRFTERDAEAKRERMEDAKQIGEKDARKQEHIKIALRMYQPWDEHNGVPVKDIVKFIDYSKSWVYDRIDEYENGAYRDLVGEDDTVKRVTAKASG